MATYTAMPALSSGATPTGDAMGLNGAGHGLGIEGFDQDLNFDDSILYVLKPTPPLCFACAFFSRDPRRHGDVLYLRFELRISREQKKLRNKTE